MTAPSRESRVVRLNQIVGVSDLNPRAADETDIGELAASLLAHGQLHDLLVEPAGNDPGEYLILDGQRRWKAMRLLVEQGAWREKASVGVSMIVGGGDVEAARAEQALAANTMRRALHPVDEYEAFARLAVAGMSDERIARDFGLDVRRVRQRLALGRVSPKIRAAWRNGDLHEDQARAYAAAETHEAQDAAYEKLSKTQLRDHTYTIRRECLADTMSANNGMACYLGEADYLAAGGRVRQDLFEDETHWLDSALAQRLAREKILAAAETIAAAEGWGFVAYNPERSMGDYVVDEWDLEFAPAEQARLDEIEAVLDDIDDPPPQLVDEEAAIRLQALLRMIPQARRAGLGVVAGIDCDGHPKFYRGWRETPAAEVNRGQPSGAPAAPRPKTGSSTAADPGSPPPQKTSGAVRNVIEAAMDEAFRACICGRPDIALTIAVARMGPTCTGGSSNCVDLPGGMAPLFGDDAVSDLLRAIAGKKFDEALPICAGAHLADLTVAFAEIVAASISCADKSAQSPIDRAAPIAAALAARAAPLAEQLDAAFYREAYFSGATKAACIAAADEISATGVNREAKKPVLAGQIAAAASAAKWLPEPLATWAQLQPEAQAATPPAATPDERPLAQAMADAIDADEAGKYAEIMRVCDLQGGAPVFGKFMVEQIEWRDGLECKASDLSEAYLIFSRGGVSRPLTAAEIGKMLANLDVARERRKDGYVYLGIGLKLAPDAESDEAAQ